MNPLEIRNYVLEDAATVAAFYSDSAADAIRAMKTNFNTPVSAGMPEVTWDAITTADEIDLRMTCGACPEQYDAYIGELQVGYLRLRHGAFRVDVPRCGGEVAYAAYPEGDGCFTDSEQDHYLNEAKRAIANWLLFSDEGKAHIKDHPLLP